VAATIEDYIARVEGTCGAEKDIIVTFKYEKKQEAIANILKKATLKNNLSGIIFELTFQGISFRVYSSGKAIFRSIKNREELNKLLADLLL
jgi:ribonuclease HIII